MDRLSRFKVGVLVLRYEMNLIWVLVLGLEYSFYERFEYHGTSHIIYCQREYKTLLICFHDFRHFSRLQAKAPPKDSQQTSG